MVWQPGQSGNPGGKTDKPWANALKVALAEAHAAGGNKLRRLAEKTVDEGLAGNMAAITEIGNRLDGRPPQTLQHEGGNPEKPISHYAYTGVPRFDDPEEPTDQR